MNVEKLNRSQERLQYINRSKEFISKEDYIYNLELLYDDCIKLLLEP